jgi:hypothetical protein
MIVTTLGNVPQYLEKVALGLVKSRHFNPGRLIRHMDPRINIADIFPVVVIGGSKDLDTIVTRDSGSRLESHRKQRLCKQNSGKESNTVRGQNLWTGPTKNLNLP